MSQLDTLASADLAGAQRVLVIPLGATEQHGPHLPLGTDTRIASALAARLAAQLPEVILAPALPYGSSGEHQDFPGTLSIGQQAVETILVELVRSATETFPRVLLISAHGGNARPLARAVRRLRAESRDVLAWDPARVWSRDATGDNDAHAGHIETSVMLTIAPDQVDLTRAQAGATAPLRALLPELVRSGVRAVSDNGVLGDPRSASREAGWALMETATLDLVAFTQAWPTGAQS